MPSRTWCPETNVPSFHQPFFFPPGPPATSEEVLAHPTCTTVVVTRPSSHGPLEVDCGKKKSGLFAHWPAGPLSASAEKNSRQKQKLSVSAHVRRGATKAGALQLHGEVRRGGVGCENRPDSLPAGKQRNP